MTALITSSVPDWPGPMGDGHGLVLGRIGIGLLAAGAVSVCLCLLLSVRRDEGRALGPSALAAAAGAVIMSATSAVIWATAVTVAVGAITVGWLAVAPGRATLAAARIAGVGAAALLAASAFAGAGGGTTFTRSAVAATLLAAGVIAVLGIPPLGGWAAGCFAALRGTELAPWAIIIAPALVISAGSATDALPPATRDALRLLLLLTGLVGALWGALNMVLAPAAQRYGRLLLTDLALAMAALGTGQGAGRPAGLVLVLMHVIAAPLLLHPARAGPDTPRRLLRLAVSGAPLTLGFWARLLVLQACAGSGAPALAAALAASALLLMGSVGAVLAGEAGGSGAPSGLGARAAAWGLAIAGLAAGIAPQAAARLVFGGI